MIPSGSRIIRERFDKKHRAFAAKKHKKHKKKCKKHRKKPKGN